MNRVTQPTEHPRSRQRLGRAIKELVRALRATREAAGKPTLMSDERFMLTIAETFVKSRMRGRSEPTPPPSPQSIAFDLAMQGFIRAIDARSEAVRGFDDYEAEWIVGATRKAVEAR